MTGVSSELVLFVWGIVPGNSVSDTLCTRSLSLPRLGAFGTTGIFLDRFKSDPAFTGECPQACRLSFPKVCVGVGRGVVEVGVGGKGIYVASLSQGCC